MRKHYNDMTELIITKNERIRMHEDQRIAAEFRAMREQYPDAAPMRIMRSIAESGKFAAKSLPGIRLSLVRTGAYVPKAKNA